MVATARNPEQLVDLEDRYSEKICTIPLDVTNEAQAKAAFEAAIASFGGLDVLVNNAGYGFVAQLKIRHSPTFERRLRPTYLVSSS